MKLLTTLVCFYCTVLSINLTFAQAQDIKETNKGDKIELVPPKGADYLEGVTINGKQIRKLIGNVHLRQNTTLIDCDSVYLNSAENSIEAFGNVRILQSDTVTLTSNRATYDGNTKQAKAFGNVTLTDPQSVVTTEQLDYNLNTNTAFYLNGGKITSGENTLTSKRGYYNTKTKLFSFRKDIVVITPESRMEADTLQYNSVSKEVFFQGPTKILNQDGILRTTSGQYNTVTQVSNFRNRTTVEYKKYTLTGDTIYHDKKNEIGLARGNVELFAKEDKTIILGDIGKYNGKTGISRVYGRALMKSIVEEDTLFLTADTLVNIDKKDKSEKRIHAHYKVKIYKSDLQGKCDSLVYNFADSTIYFYRDPVMWNKENQMTADTVYIQLNNRKIDKMYMRTNAFLVSQDTLQNLNQIKGRNMVAFFREGELKKLDVNGNGESIYFALDEQKNNQLIGMNHVECAKMTIRFQINEETHKNELGQVVFIGKPDAQLIPPHEIEEPAKKLRGLRWRKTEKPSRKEVLIR
jgi:lipopolysaccharide export system protein LptA